MDQSADDWVPHSAHWGAFSARWNGASLDVTPYEGDPAPSPLLQNFSNAMRHKARILRPMVRKAWLDRGARSERLHHDVGDALESSPPGTRLLKVVEA